MPSVQFDIDKMFTSAGGSPNHLKDLLDKHAGESPSLAAIQMWRARRAIPTSWLAAVLYALMREGIRVFDLMVRRPRP